MQAAVIELLTDGKLPGIGGGAVTEHLPSQFSRFVKDSMLHCLGDAPKHAPGVYLRIWRALEVPAEDDVSKVLSRCPRQCDVSSTFQHNVSST
jgi:hypothetical protein